MPGSLLKVRREGGRGRERGGGSLLTSEESGPGGGRRRSLELPQSTDNALDFTKHKPGVVLRRVQLAQARRERALVLPTRLSLVQPAGVNAQPSDPPPSQVSSSVRSSRRSWRGYSQSSSWRVRSLGPSRRPRLSLDASSRRVRLCSRANTRERQSIISAIAGGALLPSARAVGRCAPAHCVRQRTRSCTRPPLATRHTQTDVRDHEGVPALRLGLVLPC